MDRTIHQSFLPRDDPDVGYKGMRWITVGPPTSPAPPPTEQPYGVRDCAFRDPAGNHVRSNELR